MPAKREKRPILPMTIEIDRPSGSDGAQEKRNQDTGKKLGGLREKE